MFFVLDPEEYASASIAAASDYIDGVLSGRIVCGWLVRRAVQRHADDLRAGIFSLDVERAMRVFRFFSFLTHWKGEFAGQQFILSPWQCFIVVCVFGWVGADGYRRFRVALIQVARKNGKTSFAAGIGLYMLSADGEAGAEVYSVATKRDQAAISHKDAVQMRALNVELRSRIDAFKNNLCIPETGSKFEPLGANVNSMDGLNTHAAIMDEIHRHKDRNLWDVIEYSTGSRRQPLMLGITTAGDNAESHCYELREHAERVLTGAVSDDSFFAFIAEPDSDRIENGVKIPGDDIDDEACWPKGNPNLGISVRIDSLRIDHERAKSIPSAFANFRRYRLDKWITGSSELGLDIEAWKACDLITSAPVDGRVWYGGLDLASTQDIAAYARYSPRIDDQPAVVQCRLFCPAENIAERAKHYRVAALERWVEEGYLCATPGNVIDYGFIFEAIKEAGAVKEIAYDDWNATQIVTDLGDAGIVMVPLQQTVKTFHPPLKLLRDLLAEHALDHGGNPVLRWMASNVHVVGDPSGREKPVKRDGKRHYKIDGITAMLMAMARAIAHEMSAKPFQSVYSTRGIRML